MNISKLFSRKKIKNFCTKGVFSLLLSVFFLGGIFPVLSVLSQNPEISGVEHSYAADTPSPASASTGGTASSSSAGSDTASTTTWQQDAQSGTASIKLKQKISEFASLLISIFTPILAILIKLIESLMSDSYIMGTNGTSGVPIAQVLYELWLVFRDIMNYLFILILLFFAFMNVIAPIADNDNFALKTVLPKMIMAIVVINMTWFGARVVFDVVDVSARVVFGLPQAIMEGSPYAKALDPSENSCTINPNGVKNKFVEIKGLCKPAYVNLNSPKKEGCYITKDKIKYKKGSCFYFEPDEDDEKNDPNGCGKFISKNGVKYYSPECSTYKSEILKSEGEKNALALLIKKSTESKGAACKAGKNNTVTDKTKCERLTQKIKTLKKIEANEKLKGAVNYGPLTVYWADFSYDDFNQGTIAPMFAFSIMQIQNLPRIANTDYQKLTNEGTGWSTLVINVLISLVIMIILLVLFALMVINLFFRIIVLWVNIIFSPFYGLIIFQEQLNLPDSSSDYLGLAAFIKHAFAPVIMGVPLVIGFIMITVGKQYGIVKEGGNFGIDTPLVDNVSNLHQLFYYVLSIVVLWVGGVKAIEATSSEFVQNNMLNPIKDGVESAAKFVATAPMYINFIPVAGKDGPADLNLKQLMNMSGDISRLRDQRSSQERQDIMGGSNASQFTTKYSSELGRLQRDDKEKTKNLLTQLSKTGGNKGAGVEINRFTHADDMMKVLSGLSTVQEAQALLSSTGAPAGRQEAATLLTEAKKIKGVSGSVSKTPDDKKDDDKKTGDKKGDSGNTDTPKKVSERKVEEVIGENQKYLNKNSSTQFDQKKDYTVKIINNIGKNAQKYEKESDQKKYIKEMIKELKTKVVGKNDDETAEIHAMIDEISKKDIKKISNISLSDAENLIPDDKKV